MKTALVTGASGFIGSFLVERLIKEGFKVRCFVRKTSDLRWIKDLPVEFYYGDFTEPESLVDLPKDVECVFHSAAKKYALTKDEYDSINYVGTSNLLEACRQAETVKKFVYLSSLAVVGPNQTKKPWTEDAPCSPISFYGISKLKGEEKVKNYGLAFSTVIIRPPVVYGPRDTDLLPVFKVVKLGLKPRLGIKERFINLVYVEDLVDGIYRASQSEAASGKTYFICDREYYSYGEIVDKISLLLNKRGPKITIPTSLIYAISFIDELSSRLSNKPGVLNFQKARELTQDYWLCSPEKIEKELGVIAETHLTEGIKRTIDWYKANSYL